MKPWEAVCENCGATFTRTRIYQRYCKDVECRRERARRRQASPVSPMECLECGDRIVPPPRGVRLYCEPCSEERRRAHHRKHQARYWAHRLDIEPPVDLAALADIAAHRPDWMADAACRGMGPDLFFPGKGDGWAAAKAVCAGCPVTVECAAAAMDNHENYGVWGGTSDRERRRMRRQQREAS